MKTILALFILAVFTCSFTLFVYAEPETSLPVTTDTTNTAGSAEITVEDTALIVAIALCVLLGFFLSFYIVRKMKNKYKLKYK